MVGMRPRLPQLAALLFAAGAHAQPARRGGPTYHNGRATSPRRAALTSRARGGSGSGGGG